LGQKSGVSPVTIGHVETGKRNARRHTLKKLIDGLGITESQFFGPQLPLAEEAPGKKEAPGPHKEAAEAKVHGIPPVYISNLDLEIINRALNLNFDGKLEAIKYLKSLEK
jgi:transcriptional regulator with XRE-family HTH domain